MDQPLRPCEAAEGGFWMGAKNGFAPLQLGEGRRRPVGRNAPECAIFIEHHATEVGLAYARRVLQHGLEYGLELARRTRDDAQHLRGRRLLLQRLGQFTSAGLHLVEQPHVLNRDHRLIGVGLDKRDMLDIERLGSSAGSSDRRNDLVIPDHGSNDHRIESRLVRGSLRYEWRSGIAQHRRKLEDLLRYHRAAAARGPIQWPRELL